MKHFLVNIKDKDMLEEVVTTNLDLGTEDLETVKEDLELEMTEIEKDDTEVETADLQTEDPETENIVNLETEVGEIRYWR